MNLKAGVQSKTVNHTIQVYWDTLGDKRDFNFSCDVGQWVGKNSKVLDKARVVECCQMLADQYPVLVEIQVRDAHGRLAMVMR